MTEVDIASAANPRIRAAVRLRERRDRDRAGLTLVDGAREVGRALSVGVEVEEAFVAPSLVRTPDGRAVLDALTAARVPIRRLSATAFARLAFGDRDDGVVAVVRTPRTDLASLVVPAEPLVVVLEGIEKPGNVGAVLRTADAAGADAVLVADPVTDPFNPNAIRASLGTVFTVPVAVADTPAVRAWLEAREMRIVAARVGAASAPWDVDLTGPVAIVLGSEARGLGERWLGDDVVPVTIPMRGAADSLNVSVAAAVLLYEARRQRG